MGAQSIGVMVACAALSGAASLHAGQRRVRMPNEQEIERIRGAAPLQAPARPKKARKLLVWGHLWTHGPNPYAAETAAILGQKTGAFAATTSEDADDLLPARLAQFDAILMNNIHERDPFLPQDFKSLNREEQEAALQKDRTIKRALLEFVAGGKGLAGVHAATAALQTWPEYGELIGGYYGGHISGNVAVKLDEPDHPLNACFEGKPFRISDEIYLFREPYSRAALRVLLSLDLSQMDDPGKRPDKDYAVSWVRPYRKGRVFYCSLGHAAATYWNPLFLRHLLAGLQFALGDLEAPAAPKAE